MSDAIAGEARALGRRASFWVSAAVIGLTLWTSAAPSVTYPLYAAQWHLTSTVTTWIFAVYPLAVVAMLVLFGNISDHIGRRPTILLGLTASLMGSLFFALASNVAWVFAGRAFTGVGVGLITSPATAAMVEFSAARQAKRASSVATAATALGLALATIIGGALIQYAPFPTHLNFWVLVVAIVALFCAAWFLPRHTSPVASMDWRPAISIPKGLGRIFATSATAVTAAYAFGVIMLALGAQTARDLIRSDNALMNGAAIALLAVVSGIVAIVAKRIAAKTNIVAGGVATTVGMALLMLSASQHSLPVFLAATTTSGAGFSLLYSGGLGLISANTPPDQRAGTLSAVYTIAFVTMGVTAVLLGAAATAWGLSVAIGLGAPAVALLGIVAIVLLQSPGARVAPPPPSVRA